MFNMFGYGAGNVIMVMAAVIELIFKGIGLWKSARHNSRYWFVSMLIINSVGVLPIIYLLFFEKKERRKKQESQAQS